MSGLWADVRSRIDPRAVLDRYGAQNCHEQTNASDGTTEIIHSCILDRVMPHHSNGDRNPSAAMNVEKRTYVCYALGWGGDILRLIQKMENADGLLDLDLTPLLAGSVRPAEDFSREILRLMDRRSPEAVELPRYADSILNPWMVSHPYMREERGITQEAHEILRLGYDATINRIVFPHFQGGNLVGWQTRAIPSRPGWPGTHPAIPKYRSTPGMPKSETLYALDLADRHRLVVVVESPMSVAKAVSLGVGNVVATFGAKVTDTQVDLLKDFPEAVVWFDDDPAGRAGERGVVTRLYRHIPVSVVLPEAGRDLGDHTDASTIRRAISGSVPATMAMAEYAVAERHRSGAF